MRISILLFGVAMSVVGVANAETLEGIPRVVDGDTIKIGRTSIRLDAIDAAESAQSCATADGGQWKCGEAAAKRLAEIVAGGVVCESNKMDLYRRYLATCINTDGVNVNRTLVEEGLAWAFRRYSNEYASVEDAAHKKGIGIWQAPTMAPWDFRKGSWGTAVTAASTTGTKDCPIKGNINTKGEKIYHMPWQRSYPKVKINENKGERWFCSEAEAVSSGWRAAATR
jgi:endonuclease YncB( thermonuclease family)